MKDKQLVVMRSMSQNDTCQERCRRFKKDVVIFIFYHILKESMIWNDLDDGFLEDRHRKRQYSLSFKCFTICDHMVHC